MSRGVDWDKVHRQEKVRRRGNDPIENFKPRKFRRRCGKRKHRNSGVPAWRKEWYGRNVPYGG